MQKKQVYNPFLPLNEYIPDGEPHVFGDRVYHYGSHDREGGYTFCMEDYVVYSAPVDDLSDWRYEGVTYRASQDSVYPKLKYMYAPDVVQGNDGRYYLYYCMGGDYGIGGYTGHISVAVCDTPAGQYEYLGFVKNPDGTPMKKYICFDPAVINDDGTIRIYYGTQYCDEENSGLSDLISNNKLSDINLTKEMEDVIQTEIEMFGRSREEILSYPDSINGAITVTLCDDMLTVKEEPKHIIPYKVKGTTFSEHPFFEGPSMRKVGDKYYFIYSSWQNHELCYAVSDYPDRDFTFGGTIVSNGDVGLNGRKAADKLNMTGTTHGSIVEINGQWYVFFHRLTHKSDYSRQACAEKIKIEEDGSIKQVEVTSCGLNDGPLKAEGRYPSVIACNLTNGNMPHGSNSVYTMPFPNVTNREDDRFIGEIEDGTLIGYKYFAFKNIARIGVSARIENDDNRVCFNGPIRLDDRCLEDEARLHEKKDEIGSNNIVSSDVIDKKDEAKTDGTISDSTNSDGTNSNYLEIRVKPYGKCIGKVVIDDSSAGIKESADTDNGVSNEQDRGGAESFTWKDYLTDVDVEDGVHALYFIYHGKCKIQMKEIIFDCR